MKLNVSNIEFSRNDVRRKIKLPSKLTSELSEIIGILVGDGHVGIYPDGYRIYISGHLSKDYEYYMKFIIPLFKKLFNIEPYIKLQRINEVSLVYSSKVLTLFFKKVFNIPRNKKNISLPKIILKSNIENKCAFLRGFADTDGCIILRKKYYPTINLCNSSKILLKNITGILKELGFNFSFYKDESFDKRYNKITCVYRLDINGSKNLEKWVELIGFNNSRNIKVYEKWVKNCSFGGPAEI